MRAQIAVTGALAAALAMASFGVMPAKATPVSAPQAVSGPAAAPAGVTEVQYRRGWRGGHHHGHRRGWGRGVGPFLGGLAAGAIVGGALNRSYGYDGGGGGEDGVSRCAATFRSFNPATGTYTTYGGETRVCPYL